MPCDAGELGQIEEATGRQVCNMCPESTMQPHMGKVVCYDCDDTGLNCDYKDKIEVNRKAVSFNGGIYAQIGILE